MQSEEVIVDVDQLRYIAGGGVILRGITAQVHPGDVIALLGKNGAGKTTLLDTLLGFLVPSAGTIHLWGCSAAEIGAVQKANIGYVPQQDELMANLTGAAHLKLFRNFRQRWNQNLVEQLIFDWLIPLNIPCGKMSIGQRQKLSIVLALAHEPQLLVLDEPVASLDPIARRQFLGQLVNTLQDERRAIIFSTHIVSDAERMANKVWLLRDGALDFQGDLDFLKETCVRIVLPAQHSMLERLLSSQALLRHRQLEHHHVITLRATDESANLIAQLPPRDAAIESMSLEDIFMEMNP